MKKKIIAAVMAMVLMFTVFAMTVGAYYDINNDIIGYSCNYSITDSGDEIEFFAAVYYSGFNPPINSIRIKIQCCVVYSDNSYEYEFISITDSNAGSVYVQYDSSKTVSYIDYEVHIYDHDIYMGTCSDQIPYSLI